ncbi:unnamed protein product [Orchesella dallaii]|uniref:Uncharacterized protein n=1 Tax=Orchesella dallaii TaxID=48710 RepID=A0ABP1RYG4_9HEXA
MSKAFDDIRKFLKEKDGRPTEKFKLFTKEGHFNMFARVMLFRCNAAKLRDLNPNLVLLPKDVIWLCITKPCSIKMLEAVMPSLSDWQVICKQGLVDAIATGKSTAWNENLAHRNNVHYVTVDSWSDDDSDLEHDYDVYLPDTNVQERVYTPTTNAENNAQNNEQERAFNAPSTSTSCINNNDNSSEISTIDCQILNEYAINNLANDSDCNENITDDNMNDSGLCDMIMGSAHNEVENVNHNVEENDGIVIAIENEQVEVELANPINRNCEESIEIVPPMNENRFDRVVNFHDVREHDLMHHWKEIRTSKMWKPTINRLRRKRASIKRCRMEQLTLRCGEKNVGLWPSREVEDEEKTKLETLLQMINNMAETLSELNLCLDWSLDDFSHIFLNERKELHMKTLINMSKFPKLRALEISRDFMEVPIVYHLAKENSVVLERKH